MASQMYVNLPVEDLRESTAFYEALGFTKNPKYSDDTSSCLVWSDAISVILLEHDFYQQFIPGKRIGDTHVGNCVLLSLQLDSREDVQAFADAAVKHGGRVYTVDIAGQPEGMFGYEVEDLSGHIWEPVWMEAA